MDEDAKTNPVKNTETNFQLNCNKTISEHKENNRKLYEDVNILKNDIKERDDCHHKVVITRNLLQIEVDDLNK